LLNYIGVNDVLNLIKDLDRNDDTVEDLLTLIKNPNFKPNSIEATKYLGQFAYSVKYESQVQTHISFLLKNKLFVFDCDTIINCYSRFILLNKDCNDLIEYIKNSISCGQEFANDSKVKFDINLSKKLLNTLNSNEIEIMKSSIELAIFNDYNFIISLDIEHIKVFEYEITLKKDLIIKLLDNNLEFLKQLLEACDGISIDYSVKSKDDERMKVAKKHKLSVLYPLFKDN
ncbi:MAG: hypothetical protein J5936_02035, partial [Acholeplasmatales bacterium]|nr:hypothetical protein [Acholeplasmatales bacterium]